MPLRRRTPRALAAAVLVAAVAAVTGCAGGMGPVASSSPPSSGSGGGGGAAAAPVAAAVTIKGYAFKPKVVTVKTSGTVTFTNEDGDKHTATATNAADQRFFDTSGLVKGQSRSVTFTTAGTYAYYCAYHPFMKGTVVVR